MNGAMYEWLGNRLGIQATTIEKFEVGWCPVVQFKKTKSYDGWFTMPMRDASGKVTGLSLRNRNDDKTSFPGSKPGCFYIVNTDHAEGDKGYSGGMHNWIRTMDAGRSCPVCGKPDGCLLSRENPADPKAVVCRVKASNKPMKFGYLHILKTEGMLSNARLLPGEGPVWVVEGFSDAAVMADYGHVGLGRPSNLGGMDVVADLVRGRDTYIIGENDEKSTGEWPGRDGAIAALQTIKRVTRMVRMAMPPKGIKDVRAWKNNHALTIEQLLAHVENQGTERVDHLVLQDNKPTTVVRAFLNDLFMVNKRSHLRLWGDNWYRYDATTGKYDVVKDPEVISDFYRWSADKKFQEEGPKGVQLEDFVANTGTWANLKQAANADLLIPTQPPSWINGVKGPEATDLIVFNNGILNVPAFLSGNESYLYETTPDFFNTTALPIPFDPNAECPEWLRFINSSLGDDPAKIELLQEWLGYCMTPDTSMQKLMYLRGVTGSGKSRVMEVLEGLVGRAQSATVTFGALSGSFGLSPLVGKLTALIWDARTPKGTDAMAGLEVLLNLSGGDSVTINRKFKEQLEGQQLTARVTIASNFFIDIPDHAGAMLRRLNVIEFKRSFRENPDTTLPAKLRAEITGIAVWALAGLKRLRSNGEFTVPPSSKEAMEDWKVATNPVAGFLSEVTEVAENECVTRGELFDCWKGWATGKAGMQHMAHSAFMSFVLNTAPWISAQVVDAEGGGKVGVYMGIRLEPGAARRYIGRP